MKPAYRLAVSIATLAGATWACAAEEGPRVGHIMLYPQSTIEIALWGRCSTITNTSSETMVFLAAAKQSWLDYASGKRRR